MRRRRSPAPHPERPGAELGSGIVSRVHLAFPPEAVRSAGLWFPFWAEQTDVSLEPCSPRPVSEAACPTSSRRAELSAVDLLVPSQS